MQQELRRIVRIAAMLRIAALLCGFLSTASLQIEYIIGNDGGMPFDGTGMEDICLQRE